MPGRPKGSNRCTDCAKQRLICTHNSILGLKRSADEITLEESVCLVKRNEPSNVDSRKHWSKRKKMSKRKVDQPNFKYKINTPEKSSHISFRHETLNNSDQLQDWETRRGWAQISNQTSFR